MTQTLPGPIEAPELTPSDFQKISRLAYDHFGLNLKSGKEGLVTARLSKKMRQGGYHSFSEYYQHVVGDRTGEALIELIDALTTHYTCFLRERAHFDFLAKAATNEFRTCSPLKIWSAACSTGEEPYSIAMWLSELSHGMAWEGKFKILATDISMRVLKTAQRAAYERERYRDVPKDWWHKYLLEGRGEWAGWYKVKPAVVNRVEFERLNLIEPLPGRYFHVIFCRNVMIYFDKELQQKLVRRLTDCLEPGGYLFVGHSESLTGIEHALSYVCPAVYRKGAAIHSRVRS